MNNIEELKNYSVLYVEDNKDLRIGLSNILKTYFNIVHEASDGDEAYAIYTRNNPDIIISDIQMPNCSGVDLARKVRLENKIIPIVILTSHRDEKDLLNLINININLYILKPVDIVDMLTKIKNILYPLSIEAISLNKNIILKEHENILICSEKIVNLRKKEKEFLLLLYKNKNLITSYEQIQNYIWEDKVMTSSALKTFIKELRKKIPIKLIENISKEGYRLYK